MPDHFPAPCDLRWNYPVLGDEGALFANYIQGLSPETLQAMLRPPGPDTPTLEASARFLAAQGLPADPGCLFLLAGGHHALSLLFTLLALDGQKIAVDSITYPNFLALAASRGAQPIPCPGDAHGMTPENLRAAALQGARAAYLMPTVHNPTGAVMPLARRLALVAVARETGLWLIEDDAYAFLAPDPPASLAALAADRTFHIYSLSKPFAPGLKAALLTVPPSVAAKVSQTAILAGSSTSALLTGFLRHLLETGTLETHVLRKRVDAASRQALARTMLPGCRIDAHPSSYHLWVHPDHAGATTLCADAERHGVLLSAPASFAAPGTPPPNAFRLALGAEPDLDRLTAGLATVGQLLKM